MKAKHNYCIVLLISFIPSVFSQSGRELGLEDRIPFVSSISPSFPHYILKNHEEVRNGSKNIVYVSVHTISIKFKECSTKYIWKYGEKIIIQAVKFGLPHFNAIFDGKNVPYSGTSQPCQLTYIANIPFNLDGFPLLVLYLLIQEKVVEKSYMIKFIPSDLQIRFDKYVYINQDRLTVHCMALVPSWWQIRQIHIILPRYGFVETSRKYRSENFILDVQGIVFYRKEPLNFTCMLGKLVVTKVPNVVLTIDGGKASMITLFSINYAALGICLIMCLIILIFLGVYTLIIGINERLAFDKTAFYQEMVEDRTVRFTNPIINNLTSPLRKYRVPGVLTTFQLRKNYQRLFSLLMSKFTEKEPTKLDNKDSYSKEIAPGNGSELQRPFNKITVHSLGPLPQDTRGIKQSPPLSTGASSHMNTKSPVGQTEMDSEASLDRHVIGTLPYTKLRIKKDPHWSARNTTIPIKYGVSNEAATFMSKDTTI